jgi:hypothetical protein
VLSEGILVMRFADAVMGASASYVKIEGTYPQMILTNMEALKFDVKAFLSLIKLLVPMIASWSSKRIILVTMLSTAWFYMVISIKTLEAFHFSSTNFDTVAFE